MRLLLKLCHETRHLVLKDLELRCGRLLHPRIEPRDTAGIVERNVLTFADVDLHVGRFIAFSFLANRRDDRSGLGGRDRGSVPGVETLSPTRRAHDGVQLTRTPHARSRCFVAPFLGGVRRRRSSSLRYHDAVLALQERQEIAVMPAVEVGDGHRPDRLRELDETRRQELLLLELVVFHVRLEERDDLVVFFLHPVDDQSDVVGVGSVDRGVGGVAAAEVSEDLTLGRRPPVVVSGTHRLREGRSGHPTVRVLLVVVLLGGIDCRFGVLFFAESFSVVLANVVVVVCFLSPSSHSRDLGFANLSRCAAALLLLLLDDEDV
mmetsp:Transcript_1781/g.4627  ORF Transcript_1781/g.4627 Transcript_1781/m.4627 type:complete len:320 (+) Transcript_1781:862-1821(+)